MIKIWEYQNKSWGVAFKRISKALHEYAPSNIEWVDTIDKCDMAMVNIVGSGELSIIDRVLNSKKKLINIAHIYQTGGEIDWKRLLTSAYLTISFHNFKDYFLDFDFNFYSTPWGADSKIFNRLAIKKNNKIFSTGFIKDTEGLDLLYEACKNTNNIMYHTGENFQLGKYYRHLEMMSDKELNVMLNSCQLVSCLRFVEGFELLGPEGLFAGCRPIVPNLPTYRWYRDHGIFIDMKQDIVKQLEIILSETPKEPSPMEMKEIHNKFSWGQIIPQIFMEIK
jgi:hypothetical protein